MGKYLKTMSKTTKTILWIILAIIVIGLVWYAVSKKPETVIKEETSPVKIAYIGPLTGSFAAAIGLPHQRGLILGVQKMKDQGFNIDIISEDDQGDKTVALSIANQLLGTEKNIKVIVSPLSGVSLTLASLAQEKNIILFSTGANPEIPKANENTFRFFIDANQEAKLMAKYASETLKIHSIAILYQNDDFGLSERNAFRNEFSQRGIQILHEEAYDSAAPDLRTQMTKIIAQKPEAIVISGAGAGIVTAVKTVREFGFQGVVFSDLNALYPPLSTDLINLVEGMYVTDFKFDLNDPQVKAYVDEYHRQFGEQRVYPNSALEYGVAQIIAQTVKQCGDDVECMKQTMSSSTYDTILGKVRFDEYGNAIPPAVLKHVENGKEVIVLE